jgi:PAS domain S-box-containing protein
LREEAAARIALDPAAPAPGQASSTLLHELQVHQVELEMQNEELRRAQLALEESRDRYLDLYEFAPVGYLTLTEGGAIEGTNLTGAALLGVERNDLTRRRLEAFLAPGEVARFRELLVAAWRGDEVQACDLVFRRPDRSTFHGHLDFRSREAGRPGGPVRVAITDVSPLRHAEEALRRSEAAYSAMARNYPGGLIALFDHDLRYTFVDGPGRTIMGQEPRTLVGRSVHELYPSGHLERIETAYRAALGGTTTDFEIEIGRRVMEIRSGPVTDPDGRILLGIVTSTDVTERRRAEEALRESDRKYRSLIDNLHAGVVVHAPDTTILLGNATASELLGLTPDQMRGMVAIDPAWRFVRDDETTMPLDEYPVSRVVATGAPVVNQILGIDRPTTGDRAWVLVNAYPVLLANGEMEHVVVTFVDVTERRALQAQVALVSRLAAMGTLVAGVAHEVNNPLAVTLADQELALTAVRAVKGRLRRGEPIDREAELRELGNVVEELLDAQAGARRIQRIVRELRAFARPDTGLERLQLDQVVAKAMPWLPATVGQAASIRVESAGAPDVMASFGQLEQVVVNLVTNAAKASKPGQAGAIVIRIGQGAPGEARLEVIDDGTGIAPELLPRIFEPFFTTSDVGKGMGLGLAICHSIVTAHGGRLTVESEVGKGSTFRVSLPGIADGSLATTS